MIPGEHLLNERNDNHDRLVRRNSVSHGIQGCLRIDNAQIQIMTHELVKVPPEIWMTRERLEISRHQSQSRMRRIQSSLESLAYLIPRMHPLLPCHLRVVGFLVATLQQSPHHRNPYPGLGPAVSEEHQARSLP